MGDSGSLADGPRALLAVLAGALTAFTAYSKQSGPSQDAFRRAVFVTGGITLVCFVGLVGAAVTSRR